MSTLIARGNVLRLFAVQFTLDVTSKSAATTAEQTVSISGLKVGDIVVCVNKPSLNAGLGIANARVSAADTLAITYINATAGAIDPASETYTAIIARPEVPASALPTVLTP